MTIRTLIADDEPLARDLLARWVRLDPRLRLVGEACDGDEVLDLLEKTRAQLLFMDIKMPNNDGVDTLRAIRAKGLKPYVVFVTAFDHHAVKAYDLAAGDYLVKPVRKARFAHAVQRARLALQERAHYNAVQQAVPPLLIREGDRIIPVELTDVYWVEAASQYARIHTRTGLHLLSRPLADVASELPETHFLRVHRSALVNLGHVENIWSSNGKCRLGLDNGDEVPVARSRKKRVLATLSRESRPIDV
jgi:two-component system LytT family response regulator